MYPTRWVFFKPLPICFSPSSPLSKLPTKTTNVGSKLASLKVSDHGFGISPSFQRTTRISWWVDTCCIDSTSSFLTEHFPHFKRRKSWKQTSEFTANPHQHCSPQLTIRICIPPWRTVPAKSYGSSPLEEPPLHPLRLLQLGASSFRDSSGRRSCKIAFLPIQYPPTFTILMTTRISSTINWLVENTTTNPTEFVSQDIFSFRIGNSQSLWWFRLETTSDFVVSPLGQ